MDCTVHVTLPSTSIWYWRVNARVTVLIQRMVGWVLLRRSITSILQNKTVSMRIRWSANTN